MSNRYYVPLLLAQWKDLGVVFENSDAIGYLPVYKSVAALRKDYPNDPFITIKKEPRETELREKGSNKASS